MNGTPDLIGTDTTGSKYWRLGGAAGIGAVFVEKPGFEKYELNEPPQVNLGDLQTDDAYTPDGKGGKTAVDIDKPATEGRSSSRRVRNAPVKFEDTSMVDAKLAASVKKEKEKESVKSKKEIGQSKWVWYPASEFQSLAQWLVDGGDEGDAELAESLLEPPEVPEDFDAKDADEDDDDAMDVDDDAQNNDFVAATVAVASALAQRKRGGGTALDGYVGLDRPLIRGVSSDGPRALVALRVTLTQTLAGFPFWEGTKDETSRASRLVPLVESARTVPTFAHAKRAVVETENLFFESNVLVPQWRSKRTGWINSVNSAKTLPQLALCLHRLSEHRHRKHTGRVKMLREAFQRVGRILSTTAPPCERLAQAPYLPQINEFVVLSRKALEQALDQLVDKLGGAKMDTPELRNELGVPAMPPGLPSLLKCRVEFAGYRKGDQSSQNPAARIPHAWYLLTPMEAMAPAPVSEAMNGKEPKTGSTSPPPPLPTSPIVVPQHVFSGMTGDFLLPFEQTEEKLRRPWRVGDRVRKSFVDLTQKIKGEKNDKEDRVSDKDKTSATESSLGKRGRTKPVVEIISGTVVKTQWWRIVDVHEGKGERNKSKSPWTCEPFGAVCVKWDAAPPASAEAQAGVLADRRTDGTECLGACWISPWDVEPDIDEERRRLKELAMEQKRVDKEKWLAKYHAQREARERERVEKGLAPLEDDDSPNMPKRFSSASTLGAPRAVKVPPSTGFTEAIHNFHQHHPSGPGRALKVPTFCHVELDLHRVFVEVQSRGGFRAVTDAKRWREVCRSLGHDLSGQTSASFAMRQNYERCLLDYEAFLYEEEGKGKIIENTPDESKSKKQKRA